MLHTQGKDGCMYLWLFIDNRLRVIDGNFENGYFDGDNLVIGTSNTIITVFQISKKELQDFDTHYKLYRKLEFDAHYDQINFIQYDSKCFCCCTEK